MKRILPLLLALLIAIPSAHAQFFGGGGGGSASPVFTTWTTGTRPASPFTGQAGFNTSIGFAGTQETYDGSNWVPSAFFAGGSNQNIALGYVVGTGGGAGNVYMGYVSGNSITDGSYNIAIGDQCLNQADDNNCVAIGYRALNGAGIVSNSIGIGWEALVNVVGPNNLGIGYGVGSTTLTTGSNNILIGNDSEDVPAASTSNYLNLGAAIYGTGIEGGTVQIGINQPAPAYTLDVLGSVNFTGTLNQNGSPFAASGLAGIAQNTVLGSVTSGTTAPATLTATQLTTIPNVFSSSLKGLVPASGGGTTNFLRADGTFAAPGGGGSGVTSLTGTANQIDVSSGTGNVTLSLDTAIFLPGTGAITLPSGSTSQQVNQGSYSLRGNTDTGNGNVEMYGGLSSAGWNPVCPAFYDSSTNPSFQSGIMLGISNTRPDLAQNGLLRLRASASSYLASSTKMLEYYSSGHGPYLGVPSMQLDDSTNISPELLIIPSDTTANRPATPLGKGIRFNSSTSIFEGWNGSSWGSLAGGPITTVAGSVSGNYYWSMPQQSASWKKVIITFAACTDAGGTITYPVAFTNTPSVFTGTGIGALTFTTTTTVLTVPATTAATTTVTVEGF